jgi:hypothetical protein
LGAWASLYRIDPQALMWLLISGRLLLIFEGFDEMALIGNYQSSFMEFLNPILKLTFGYVQSWHSYLDSATPFRNLRCLAFLLSCPILKSLTENFLRI